MTPHEKSIAYLRTYIPYAIGAFAAWLFTSYAIALPDDLVVAIIAFSVVAAQNVYYLVIRLLEQWVPWLGLALGWPKQPAYEGLSNLWASVIRTGIPSLAGALVFLLLAWVAELFGFHLDPDTQSLLIVIVIGILQAIYYAAARQLVRWFPAAKWLLLDVSAPELYFR